MMIHDPYSDGGHDRHYSVRINVSELDDVHKNIILYKWLLMNI